jgi:hypothetical protein
MELTTYNRIGQLRYFCKPKEKTAISLLVCLLPNFIFVQTAKEVVLRAKGIKKKKKFKKKSIKTSIIFLSALVYYDIFQDSW